MAARDDCDRILWQLYRVSSLASRFKVGFTQKLASYEIVAVTSRQRAVTATTLKAGHVINAISTAHHHFRGRDALTAG